VEPSVDQHQVESLSLEVRTASQSALNFDSPQQNTLWTNTVVASGTVIGVVIYTGMETRSAMNANQPMSKVGILDFELNRLSKVRAMLTNCVFQRYPTDSVRSHGFDGRCDYHLEGDAVCPVT